MKDRDLRTLVGVLAMIVESDTFHLEMAKALLSAHPISEKRRAALRNKLAKRESRHEQIESLLEEMKQILK